MGALFKSIDIYLKNHPDQKFFVHEFYPILKKAKEKDLRVRDFICSSDYLPYHVMQRLYKQTLESLTLYTRYAFEKFPYYGHGLVVKGIYEKVGDDLQTIFITTEEFDETEQDTKKILKEIDRSYKIFRQIVKNTASSIRIVDLSYRATSKATIKRLSKIGVFDKKDLKVRGLCVIAHRNSDIMRMVLDATYLLICMKDYLINGKQVKSKQEISNQTSVLWDLYLNVQSKCHLGIPVPEFT